MQSLSNWLLNNKSWDRRQPARTGAMEYRVRGIYSVESYYQATTSEDTAYWKDLVSALINCRVCEVAVTLLSNDCMNFFQLKTILWLNEGLLQSPPVQSPACHCWCVCTDVPLWLLQFHGSHLRICIIWGEFVCVCVCVCVRVRVRSRVLACARACYAFLVTSRSLFGNMREWISLIYEKGKFFHRL
jgi:hypothetical protein